jgi:hypothetical protein
MRDLLEFLGLLTTRGRREPAAVPRWYRLVFPALVTVLAILSVLISAFVRAWLS